MHAEEEEIPNCISRGSVHITLIKTTYITSIP